MQRKRPDPDDPLKVESGTGPSRFDLLCTWLVKLWQCYIWKNHDWTCAAAEGIPPTDKQLADGIKGFYDYATMYCKRCKHESELSRREKEKVHE